MLSDSEEISTCLREIHLGRPGAEARLLDRVYDHLRTMAGQRMRRERDDHTLQPTALANEAWLRLIQMARRADWAGNRHFYATCGRIMRNILIDYARRRKIEKVDLEMAPGIAINGRRSEELLELDAALDRLAGFDSRGAKVVELIFFGGLTYKEVAAVLKVSERTVKRDFAACRAWLRCELRKGLAHQASAAAALGRRPAPLAARVAASHS